MYTGQTHTQQTRQAAALAPWPYLLLQESLIIPLRFLAEFEQKIMAALPAGIAPGMNDMSLLDLLLDIVLFRSRSPTPAGLDFALPSKANGCWCC